MDRGEFAVSVRASEQADGVVGRMMITWNMEIVSRWLFSGADLGGGVTGAPSP